MISSRLGQELLEARSESAKLRRVRVAPLRSGYVAYVVEGKDHFNVLTSVRPATDQSSKCTQSVL